MERLRTSFANFVAACVVALHLVLLPALYYGLGYVIRKSHEDLFIEHARTFARVLADEFELGVALESGSRTEDLLDLAIIHGDGRYAELVDNGHSVLSKLGSPSIKAPRRTDLSFAEGGTTYSSSYCRSCTRGEAPNCASVSTSSPRRKESILRSTGC